MAAHRPCHRDSAAFTLVELMVVLAIVTLLGLVAGRAMTRQDNSGAVSRFAHQVLVAMRQARTEAVESGRVIQLAFRSDGKVLDVNGASLLGPGPPSGSVWQRLYRVEAGNLALVQAIKKVAEPGVNATPGTGGLTSDPDGIVLFLPDGTTAFSDGTSGSATIYIRDDASSYYAKVLLFGITGYSHLLPRW